MARRLYALRATNECILLYPLYAVLFADAGLSAAQIGSLFVIWSALTLALEIPSGAWADTFPRRYLIAGGGLLRAVGFGLWTWCPAYWSFAVGFGCWAVQSALKSGALEALVHDELAAVGATGSYLRLVGRAAAVAQVAMVVGTALAVPVFRWGGYPLIGAVSVATCVLNAAIALTLPEVGRVGSSEKYLVQLRAGLGEVRFQPVLRRAVLLAAVLSGLGAVDEYVGLLARDAGVPTAAIPVVLLLPIAAMAVAGWWADRAARVSGRWLAAGLAVAAVGLAVGALSRHPAGLLALAVFFGIWQLTRLVLETRVQALISVSARATVLSTVGFGAEVFALLVFCWVALGGLRFSLGTLVALVAVPVLLAAAGLRVSAPVRSAST